MPNADRFPSTWQHTGRGFIPNGKYTLRNPTLLYDFSFLVWTVQTGSLIDQQIVKRKVGNTYKGFATVMSDGTIKLWRSHDHMRDEELWQIASDFFAVIGAGFIAAQLGVAPTMVNVTEGEFSATLERSCLRCNRGLDVAVDGPIFCTEHHGVRLQLRTEIENDERATHYTAQRARRRTPETRDMTLQDEAYSWESSDGLSSVLSDVPQRPIPRRVISSAAAAVAGSVASHVNYETSAQEAEQRLDALRSDVISAASRPLRSSPSRPFRPGRINHQPTVPATTSYSVLLSENGTGLIR